MMLFDQHKKFVGTKWIAQIRATNHTIEIANNDLEKYTANLTLNFIPLASSVDSVLHHINFRYLLTEPAPSSSDFTPTANPIQFNISVIEKDKIYFTINCAARQLEASVVAEDFQSTAQQLKQMIEQVQSLIDIQQNRTLSDSILNHLANITKQYTSAGLSQEELLNRIPNFIPTIIRSLENFMDMLSPLMSAATNPLT